jgi:hypothetical protein
MAVTPNSFIFPQKPRMGRAYNGNLDANLKTFFTAGANGSKVVGIILSQNSGVVATATIGLVRGGVHYLLGTATVNIIAGWNYGPSTRTVCDGMAPSVMGGLPVDEDGNRYLLLMSGDSLQFRTIPPQAANTWMWALAIGYDY